MEQEGGLMAKMTATICEGVDFREKADELLRRLLWLKAVEVQVETDANAEWKRWPPVIGTSFPGLSSPSGTKRRNSRS